ncbi:hypothetical protein HDE_07985 [Halotydeus destructor]|nr:hypothetical protein HDE_07985 [Halotydeus destructor]
MITLIALIILFSNANCQFDCNRSASGPSALYTSEKAVYVYHEDRTIAVVRKKLDHGLPLVSEYQRWPHEKVLGLWSSQGHVTAIHPGNKVCHYNVVNTTFEKLNCSAIKDALFQTEIEDTNLELKSMVAIDHGKRGYYGIVVECPKSIIPSQCSKNPNTKVKIIAFNKNFKSISSSTVDSVYIFLAMIVGTHGDERFHVFRKNVYAETEPGSITPNFRTIWRPSRPWLGCPTELCFDGTLDAVAQSNLIVKLHRGLHVWTLRDFSPTRKLSPPVQINFGGAAPISRLDAAMFNSVTSEFYYISAGMAVIRRADNSFTAIKTEDFLISHHGQVDALAEGDDGTIYVISGSEYTRFKSGNGSRFIASSEHGHIGDLWPGLPQTVDTLAKSSSGYIFFKGNFHFRFQDGGLVGPNITQNVLFECEDGFYKQFSGDVGINSYQIFANYANRFKPQQDSSPPKRTTINRPIGVSVNTLRNVVFGLILLLMVMIVAAILIYIYARKLADSQFIELSTTMAGPNVDTMTTDEGNADKTKAKTIPTRTS